MPCKFPLRSFASLSGKQGEKPERSNAALLCSQDSAWSNAEPPQEWGPAFPAAATSAALSPPETGSYELGAIRRYCESGALEGC